MDNASGDGSAQRIAAEVPQARLVRSASNIGFAGGCNLGVSNATGSIVAFLNNDARPHRDWVAAAVDYEPRSIAYHRHHASLRGADPAAGPTCWNATRSPRCTTTLVARYWIGRRATVSRSALWSTWAGRR